MNILLGGLKGYEKTFDFFHLQKKCKIRERGKNLYWYETRYSIEYFHRKLIVHFETTAKVF